MRSKFGSRSASCVVAALIIALSPLGSLQAAEAAEAAAESSSATESAASTEKASDTAADAGAKDAATGADAQADKGAKESGAVKHKSPGMAGGLAFFPGIVVHGAGHMYAGSWVKGLGLLAIEGAAAAFAINAVTNGANDIQKIADGTKNGAIPTNVGVAYQTVGVIAVSTMAFLWTWFDDMAGAPIAANEYNRLADEAAGQARFQVQPQGDGAALALVKHF